MLRYEPANSLETPRFSGVRTFMRLPNVQDLENADATIIGAPFDTATTFRVGARFGPEGFAAFLTCSGLTTLLRMSPSSTTSRL